MSMPKAAIIGAGFSGLSVATHLAHAGFDVTVYEKNSMPGGRARKFEANNFTFDMGPSWYWMPDVFEKYFETFNKSTSDYYTLQRLDPSYRIFYGENDYLDIPASIDALCELFNQLEPGSSKELLKFLKEGKFKYETGMNELVHKPGLSITELINWKLISGSLKLHVFQSMSTYIHRFFKNPRIVQLLEFPVLFLGATPENTPALYSLMNYADLSLGTWYPRGGMYKIAEGMKELAEEKGVQFRFNGAIDKLHINGHKIEGVHCSGDYQKYDCVIASADYHYVEQNLLPKELRRYSEKYWNNRVMAPSCLLFYVGLNKKLKSLLHHTLFFDTDFSIHAREIYNDPKWPTAPQFYVSCPSKTDEGVAPPGHENLMILIPVAPGLHDNNSTREKYFDLVIDRLESITEETIKSHIVYKRTYAHNDFIADYHAFKGNAYGLANTLSQTANLKPAIVNKKVSNLFYTGQLTVPGPGIPPSIISGGVVAKQVLKALKIKNRT
jgi:phytoene desaturase